MKEGEQDSQINTIQAATLGLLGLLLAFTFSMAAAMALFLIVIIIGVIIDLDRPRRGLIRVSQESMIQLQQSI